MTQPLTAQVILLRLASALVIASSFASAVYVFASAPTREASRLGLRGLKRQRALASNEFWASIEPLVRWLGVRVSGIPTDEQRAALDRQISLSGDYLGITPDEYIALTILSGLAGVPIGALAGYQLEAAPIGAVAGLIAGLFYPYSIISGKAQQRMKDVGRALPYVNDLMALAMGAGSDFPGAVRQVVDKTSNPDDPIVEEMTLVLQTIALGRTRKDALEQFAWRVPAVSVVEFVNAIVQAEERGNPVSEVLEIQATTSRVRRSVRAEELAAKAGTQMVFPLMLIMFCVLCLMIGPLIMTIAENF